MTIDITDHEHRLLLAALFELQVLNVGRLQNALAVGNDALADLAQAELAKVDALHKRLEQAVHA